MPNYTSNYNLTKPLGTDLYDISVFNQNADIIDKALHDTLTKLTSLNPRTIGAIAEQATYYSSAVEVDLDTTTQSLLLIDKKWSKDCPLCTDSGFVFVMQLFFGTPSPTANRTQIAISYGDAGDNVESGIAIRCYFTGSWTNWTELYGPHNLPVVPIEKGGTGTSGWHQALTNLRAMERQAVYHTATDKPDINVLTDSLMLIPSEYTKNCPVGGGFVYIMQVFYASIDASSNRTQIAFPYMVDGVVGKGIATRSYQNGKWSDWNLLASADDHKIKTYSSLVEIGLTPGTETIESIVNALGVNAELICVTGEGYANIYPDIYGMLRVTCIDSSRVHFKWTSKSVPIDYVGIYSASNSTKWSGWKKVYNAAYPPTPEDIGAVKKSGDTVNGWLDFGQYTCGLKWTTADGTLFRLRPYYAGNIFQVTRTDSSGEYGTFNIRSDGQVYFGEKPLEISSGGTGATDKINACKNIGAAMVAQGERIPENADLNNYTTPGTYYSVSGDNSKTLGNAPYTETGFKLEVFNTVSANHWIQEIKANSGAARTFRRVGSSSGGWNTWYQVLQTSDNVVPVSMGGTGATTAAGACENIGAVKKSGDTMTGTLQIAGDTYTARIQAIGDNISLTMRDSSAKIVNGITFKKDATGLTQPLTLSSGGTGATTATGAVDALWDAIAAKIEATYNVTKK